MKSKATFIVLLFLGIQIGLAQGDFKRDSIQIKVYNSLVINSKSEVDTIYVNKVFCNYCNSIQKEAVEYLSMKMTYDESKDETYNAEGKYRVVHHIRIARKDFNELVEN